MENVVMTPNVGTQTTESHLAMEYEHRDKMLGFLLGDRPVAYVYNPAAKD
jgi:glyoxylate reductase